MPEVTSLQEAVNAVESFAVQDAASRSPRPVSHQAPVDRGTNTSIQGTSRTYQSKEIRDESLVDRQLQERRASQIESDRGERFKGRVLNDVF